MKIKLFIIPCILFIFLSIDVYTHTEFFRLNGCVLEVTYSIQDALRWQSYFNIPICKNFNADHDFPSDLIKSECEDDFSWAIYEWPSVSFEEQTYPNDESATYIRVRFTDDRMYFPVPAFGEREAAAGTWFATNDFSGSSNYIVGQNIWNQCTDYTNNWILFNNCSNRTFYWTRNTFIMYDDILNFRYCLTHELGHELGLAHCSISTALMYATPPPAPYFVNFIPQPPDVEGINLLVWQNPGSETILPKSNKIHNLQRFFFETGYLFNQNIEKYKSNDSLQLSIILQSAFGILRKENYCNLDKKVFITPKPTKIKGAKA